jgi:anti-anti-sigma regulatory factor
MSTERPLTDPLGRQLPSLLVACQGGDFIPTPARTRTWTYIETIDDSRAVIRVRGRVDRLAADLLRGTVEQLHRRGHQCITVALGDAVDVDPAAHAVLGEVATALARRRAQLIITGSPRERRGVS